MKFIKENILELLVTIVVMSPLIFAEFISQQKQEKIIKTWQEAVSKTNSEIVSYDFTVDEPMLHGSKGRYNTLIKFNEYEKKFYIGNKYSFFNEDVVFNLTTFNLEGKKCVYSIDVDHKGKSYNLYKIEKENYPSDLENYIVQKCF